MTWGILRLHGTDHRCAILNTHLPYEKTGEEARLQSAGLIVDKRAEFPPDLPLFLTGDFNALPDSPIHSLLTSELHDAWLTAEHTTGPAGTLHGFGRTSAERRLDWILYRNAVRRWWPKPSLTAWAALSFGSFSSHCDVFDAVIAAVDRVGSLIQRLQVEYGLSHLINT